MTFAKPDWTIPKEIIDKMEVGKEYEVSGEFALGDVEVTWTIKEKENKK
jgi:hypothetical protein